MNCKSVQKWLPLYVSRDLEENRRRPIAAHVQSCAECAGIAREYDETRQLLRDFVPPAFSESVYSDMRQRVLREIEVPAAKAAPLTRLFAGVLRPRLSWAVATVVLVVVGLFGFYLIANRGNDNQPLAGSSYEGTPQKPSTISSPPVKKSDGLAVKVTSPATAERRHRLEVRRRFAPAADRVPSVAFDKRPQRSINQAAFESNKLNEPSAVQSSEKVFRLEMQTKDPNIRIIWLTPQRTKRDLPGKVSKGV